MRLLVLPLLVAIAGVMHLRTSRRKGNHNEKAHGSWSSKNPFTSYSGIKRVRSGGKKNFKVGDKVAFVSIKRTRGSGNGVSLKGGRVVGKRESGSLVVNSGRYKGMVLPANELLSTKGAKRASKVKLKRRKK